MSIKQVITRSNGKHKIIVINYRKLLTNVAPHKPLLKKLKSHAGRNNTGKITVRHRGGGHKRLYRIIDFKRDRFEIPAIVKTLEYDPYRTSFIALLNYVDGQKRYILCPHGLKVGMKITSSKQLIDLIPGNAMPIGIIPDGTVVHNVELIPTKGGKIVRSAGTQAQILGKDLTGNFTIIKLSSKENRKIPNNCLATIGQVSNINHNLVRLGKAGKKRYLGIRPTVRGTAMNPNDHAHGGGEGRCPIGRDAPRTPWGKRHMGVKTRTKNKKSNFMIVKSRHLRNK